MYYAEVAWWNDFSNEDMSNCMFITAGSYEEAIRYITESFNSIVSITIEEISDEECHAVYVPKELAQQVKEENIY